MKQWEHTNNALFKKWEFSNFSEAFAFISRVALLAEQLNHHPEIGNQYNIVWLKLSTHDAGNVVTEKDWTMAAMIDRWTS
jgi:4a-hydroxytetrahydrobiopterin dehydratase